MDIDGPAAATGAYEFALHTAEQRGHRRATRQLEAIGPPPHLTAKQFGTRVRWATNFGGVTTGETYASWPANWCPAWCARPITRPGHHPDRPRITATQAALLPDLASMDLTRSLPRIDVPVVMVQGRHDQVAPGESHGSTPAPCKRPASS